MKRYGVLVVFVVGCSHPAPVVEPSSSSAPAQPESAPAEPESAPKPPPVPTEDPGPARIAGLWYDGEVVLGDVRKGQTLHFVSPKDLRWSQTVESVDEEGVGFQVVELSERPESASYTSPWRGYDIEHEGFYGVDNDPVLKDLFLVGIDAEPPAVLPAPGFVHYRGALCETEGDAEGWMMMESVTSSAPDPLEGALDLDPILTERRRTVSLTLPGQRIHFVSAVALAFLGDRRMSSLPRDRDEVWLVLRERGGRFDVLQRTQGNRHAWMNHDYSCQLPVNDPIPFAAREEADGLAIYTMSPSRIQRWLLDDDGLRVANSWATRDPT